MQLIKIIYESFCRSLIRFWDNRFVKNTEVEYYRMQIEQLRLENKELQDKLLNVLMPKPPTMMPDEPIDWKPVSTFVPWHIKRQQLELESLKKAREQAAEADGHIKKQSTEELEKAVGIS